MRSLTKLSSMVALFMIGVPAAFAQPRSGTMPRYNTSTESKITGTVQDVIQYQQGRGWHGTGTHLIIKAGGGTFDAHLGPASYISSQGFTFAKDDVVNILGSKVTVGGKDAIIAREVAKDGKTLTLRDKVGHPMWAGRGRL